MQHIDQDHKDTYRNGNAHVQRVVQHGNQPWARYPVNTAQDKLENMLELM